MSRGMKMLSMVKKIQLVAMVSIAALSVKIYCDFKTYERMFN